MKQDMKLIMENWRGNIREQDQSMVFDTLGELRKAIATAIKYKKAKATKDQLAQTGGDALLGAVPVIGNAASIAKGLFDLAKAAYSLDDEEQAGPGLESLNVDDMISLIVDDRIENKFLNSYLKQFANYPDSTPLDNLNATKALQSFIANQYRRKIQR